MSKVEVYLIHTDLIKSNLDFVLGFVDEERKQKAFTYSQEKDKLLSLGAAYLMKKYLPEGVIKETKNGKPYLENGPFFNLSHSVEYSVLVIHPSRDVGVDIQIINNLKLDAIRYVLNDEEKEISDLNSLHLIWSNKESLVKCISTGLNDIIAVPGLPLNGLRKFKNVEYFSESQLFENYSLSVTLKGNEPFNTDIINIKEVI